MTEFEITVKKYGDPLLDEALSPASIYCLIDREHKHIVFGLSDPRFDALKDETRMEWLRKFGVVSDAYNQTYKFPSFVEEVTAKLVPPNQYSSLPTISISLEPQLSRESVAQFARALWKLLEIDEIAQTERSKFILSWKNYSNESFSSKALQFIKRPKIVSQT
jgi:hypothetical protein